MAARTGIVIGLRPGCVTLSSGKIDVIVARTTRGASRFGQPVDVLTSSAVVTRVTAVDLLGISRMRKIVYALIVPDDDVRLSRLDAREVRSRVNLVDHDLQVDGIARVGIRCLGGMAGIAKEHLAPAASMLSK